MEQSLITDRSNTCTVNQQLSTQTKQHTAWSTYEPIENGLAPLNGASKHDEEIGGLDKLVAGRLLLLLGVEDEHSNHKKEILEDAHSGGSPTKGDGGITVNLVDFHVLCEWDEELAERAIGEGVGAGEHEARVPAKE